MATESTSSDAKKAGGYLKEKLGIIGTRLTSDEVERAVLKVTSHKLKIPNEKHMQRLIEATYGRYNSGSTAYEDVCGYIVQELELRTHAHNWIIVLKTLLTLHRLMVNGSPQIISTIIEKKSTLFCFSSIKELADSPDGAAQKRVVFSFLRELEERGIALSAMSIPFTTKIESLEFTAALSVQLAEAMGHNSMVFKKSYEALIQWAEVIGAVELETSIINNFASCEVYNRIATDGKRVYILLMELCKSMLKKFKMLPATSTGLLSKKDVLHMIKQFQRVEMQIAKFFHSMIQADVHFGVELPNISPTIPASIIESMEDDYLQETVPRESIDAFRAPETEKRAEASPPAKEPAPLPPPPRASFFPSTAEEPPQTEPAVQQQRLDLFDQFNAAEPAAVPSDVQPISDSFDPFAYPGPGGAQPQPARQSGGLDDFFAPAAQNQPPPQNW